MRYAATAHARRGWFTPMMLSDEPKQGTAFNDVPSAPGASDRWYRLLLNSRNTFAWEAGPKRRRFTFVGEQSAKLLGYTPQNCCEPNFWADHIYGPDAERAVAESWRRAKDTDNYQLEYRMLTSDGRIVWVQDMVNVIREKGKPATLRGFITDITNQKETEDALRDLGARLMSQQEEERKRVARDLHDDLSQRMAILCMDLDNHMQRLGKARSDLRESVHEIQVRAKEISNEIHRVSYALHPSKLDDLGLAAAVNSCCQEIEHRHKIKVKFTHHQLPADISKEINLCVFRVAQEALTNIARHSGAQTARVRLEIRDDKLRLVISDTGIGFDMCPEKMRKGLGFISMTERLRILNGDISITSKLSAGTTIEATVPLTSPRSTENKE